MTEKSADAVVIGGGLAGLAIGAELAVDRSVVVLEQEHRLAVHATGRSTATYSPTYGSPVVRALTQASRPDFSRLEDAFGHRLLKPRPVMWVADQQSERHLAEQVRLGGVEQLDVASALALCPALHPRWLRGAALDLSSSDVDVPALLRDYVQIFEQRGGTVMLDHPAEQLSRGPRGWTVHTADATFRTPLVINAAGAWIDVVAKLAGVDPVGALPFRRTICIAESRWETDIASWPMVIDTGTTEHAVGRFYFKPHTGRQILFSPCEEVLAEPGDVQPDREQERLALESVNSATRLGLRGVTRSWAGLRTFVGDRLPVVGFRSNDPGFFWFGGQGGYGIQLMPALARAGAALATSRALPSDMAAAGITAEAMAPNRPQPAVS